MAVCLAVVAALCVATPVATTTALASPGALAADGPSAPQLISGPDPLPAYGSLGGFCGSTPEFQNWEQEPSLAVDPGNANMLASAWIQDYADAIAVASSSNGGAQWTHSLPHGAACTWLPAAAPDQFKAFNSAFDPSISFGPSRLSKTKVVTYLTSVLANARDNSSFAVVANRSTDGGRTWSEPSILDRSTATPVTIPPVAPLPGGTVPVGQYLDWSNVVADPVNPDRAYAIWQRGDSAAATRATYTSHTVNGGLDWSPAAPGPASTGALQAAGRLLVLPDGSVVDVFVEVPPQPTVAFGQDPVGPTTIVASRSTDGGVHWGLPTPVAIADPTRYVVPGVGIGRDGAISVAWQKANADGTTFDLLHARSTDGGANWSPPTAVEAGVHGPRSPADVAISPDGTIGVLDYDHRNDTTWYDNRGDLPRKPPTVTDAWLHTSRDLGKTWDLAHLAGPFDQTTAPLDGFLGDYQGIAPLPRGFATAFTLAAPLSGANFTLSGPPTDIFFSRSARP